MNELNLGMILASSLRDLSVLLCQGRLRQPFLLRHVFGQDWRGDFFKSAYQKLLAQM